jgi:hypothetical protein
MMNFIQKTKYGALAALLIILSWGCEDPNETFDPVNPNLSGDNVTGTIQSSARVLNGAERQLSLLMNEIVAPTEIATDNYENTATFFNQFLDDLAIDPTDSDVSDIQFDIARLRELTTTGLDEIGPADEGYSGTEEAGFHFLRGLSYLFGGELFSRLPAEPMGATVPAETHLMNAIEDFTAAMNVDGGGMYSDAALLARARAYYRLGDKSNAVSDAQAAIAATPMLLYKARYDGVEGPFNTMQDALFDRGTFDDLQPLPSLDFLDPKYNGFIPNVEVGIPVIKIEEAHLILAEAALSDGDLDEAKSIMKDIIDLVESREVQTFSDRAEGRTENAPGSRPDTSIVEVAVGPDRPFESGLVINRQVPSVTVPTVSGTSYTDAEVDNIADIEFAYESLYRMRQEIFIAEGRRFTDLGLRLVVSQTEADANPNITDADLQPTIPSWLNSIRGEFDDFTYDVSTARATIQHNLNRLTAENRASDLVAPFE